MGNFFKSIMIFTILLLTSYVEAKSISEKHSNNELHCLALNIYFEARSESKTGQFAVAAVTMNRVASWRYPNTICKVVWHRYQFSWTHDGKSDRPKDQKSWKEAKEIAAYIYKNYFKFQKISNGAWDITQGSLNYYAHKLVHPYWAKNAIPKIKIGGHIFVKHI